MEENNVSKERMALRVLYSRESNELFIDNVFKYGDWLEKKLAKILAENKDIADSFTKENISIDVEIFIREKIAATKVAEMKYPTIAMNEDDLELLKNKLEKTADVEQDSTVYYENLPIIASKALQRGDAFIFDNHFSKHKDFVDTIKTKTDEYRNKKEDFNRLDKRP